MKTLELKGCRIFTHCSFASKTQRTFLDLGALQMEKIWGVWCKEVQCSVIGELKHLSLKSFELLEYKDAL